MRHGDPMPHETDQNEATAGQNAKSTLANKDTETNRLLIEIARVEARTELVAFRTKLTALADMWDARADTWKLMRDNIPRELTYLHARELRDAIEAQS